MAQHLIALFPGDNLAPPSYKMRILHWWQRHKNRFSTSLVLSILFHTCIFGAIVMAEFSVLSPEKDSSPRDYQALMQALAEMEAGQPKSGQVEKDSAKISEADVRKSIGQSALFDSEISGKEKVQIFKKLIESYLKFSEGQAGKYVEFADVPIEDIYALLGGGKAVELSSGDKAFVSKPIGKQNIIEFYKLDALRESMIKRLRQNEKYEKEWPLAYGDMVRVDTKIGNKSGVRAIPKEIYFRNCPYPQMLAEGAALFSIVKGFPVFETGPRAAAETENRPSAAYPMPKDRRDLVIVLYRTSASGQFFQSKAPAADGVRFSDEKIRRILDELMVMPESEQFDYFEKYYLRRFDAASEDLAKLAREFLYNNLNSVFYMVDNFTLAFDFLEELFFKRPIYDYFPYYWRQNQGTGTGIEILFCLADSYDFENRALTYLDEAYKEARDILSGRTYKTNIFSQKVKAYVIKEIYEDLRSGLESRGYHSLSMISKKYVEEAAGIYSSLTKMGGDVRNRALFALGVLDWNDGRSESAYQKWRQIDATYSHAAFKAISPYLSRTGESLSEAVPKITEILTGDSGGNDKKMLDRLLKFHKWKIRENTFR